MRATSSVAPKHLTGRKGSGVWQAGGQIIKTVTAQRTAMGEAARDAFAALAALHAAGWIHGDVQAENVTATGPVFIDYD